MSILVISAVTIAFTHTLMGPDHYLPFIMISKAKKWSLQKTMSVTALCGVGHVLSSVILGFLGIAFGIALRHLTWFEAFRGNIAAYLLIAFGLAYFLWGLNRAWRNKPHTHFHFHSDGTAHSHTHTHFNEHTHVHEKSENITPWILFLIFVFGPCEPLIPLLMYPAAQQHWSELLMVAVMFSAITIATMSAIVFLFYKGIDLIPLHKFDRFTHAIAGFTIFLCGLGIQFLGF